MDDEERQAWTRAKFATAPYRFQRANRFLRANGTLAVPSVRERERLLGFRTDHTLPALSSSAAKHDRAAEFAERASQCGNSMSCYAVAWLLGQLAFRLGMLKALPSIQQILQRSVRSLIVDASPACLPS